MQRTHAVKAIRKHLNDQVEVIPIKDGAYRPLKPALTTVIEHEVPAIVQLRSCSLFMNITVFILKLQIRNHPDRFADEEICVKLSGDGARFSSSSSFLLLSFSLPGLASNALSGAGIGYFGVQQKAGG